MANRHAGEAESGRAHTPEYPTLNGASSGAANAWLRRVEALRAKAQDPAVVAARKAADDQRRKEQEAARRSRTRRRLERSGLPQRIWAQSLADLTAPPFQAEARAIMEQFVAAYLVGERDWWVVLEGWRGRSAENPGANGIGKSTLARTAAVELCRAGAEVRVYTESSLNRALFGALDRHGDEGLADLVQEMIDADLLVLDNMGTDSDCGLDGVVMPVKDFVRQQLFDVVDSRMEAPLPLLITTNLDSDQFERRYGYDIYSRVSGMALQRDCWVRMAGPDLRRGSSC